jgi:hypothetical protein
MTKKALNSKASADTVPELVFKSDFQQDLTGEIKAGSEVAILFDAERLPLERSLDEKGKSAWTISAFYQFAPGGEVNKLELAKEKAASKKKKAAAEATLLKGILSVPAGTEEAVLWFLNTGPTGNEYYDSDFGKNYRFPVLAEIVEEEAAPVKKRRTKKSDS